MEGVKDIYVKISNNEKDQTLVKLVFTSRGSLWKPIFILEATMMGWMRKLY